MAEKMENEKRRINFTFEDLLILLWNKKWVIVIVTLFFAIGGVILFKASKKPQFYKYTINFSLQYGFDTGEGHFAWVECERLPWKMVKIDYSKVVTDSVFLKKLISDTYFDNNHYSQFPFVVEAYDSLHLAISLVAIEERNVETEILYKMKELFPLYVASLQRDKLCLENYLLEKKKNQVLSILSNKQQYLQSLLDKKSRIIDRMEIARLENECQVLYNSSLELVTQLSTVQTLLKENELLVLKADDKIIKEQVIGGPFSHMSMFLLLFAFVGFMIVVNVIVIKAYLIEKR